MPLLKEALKKIKKSRNFVARKLLKRTHWHNLRNLKPISRVFGFDRGTPIDRYYIEQFLSQNRKHIQGDVLEISEDTYSKKYGQSVKSSSILHVDSSNPKATLIGDLTRSEGLPVNKFGCFICTQTLNVIYDFTAAIRGSHQMLRPGGVMLATVAGLCQISRYDMDRWGDYWRFTNLSIKTAFTEVFGNNQVDVVSYGNVLSAVALLEGIAAEEMKREELDFQDNDYQILLGVCARKI